MFRIDDPSAAASLPVPEAANTEGYWIEGNPVSGTQATLERASWFNMVQEELRAIVVAGAITPSKTVYNQILTAIKRLCGRNVTAVNFAASPFALTADNAGLVLVDATAGNVVLNLPAANIFAALSYQIKRVDATANSVTLNRAGADTIDGATSVTLSGQGAIVRFLGDGVSEWQTVQTQRGYAKFTANGNFTVPAGVTAIYCSGVAGGGGGGGGGASQITGTYVGGNGGGGGAGQPIIKTAYTVTPGAVLAVTIGAAGTAGTAGATGGASGGTGGSGGTTSLGSLFTLTGGTGGSGANSSVSVALGGSGGAGYPAGLVGSNVGDGSASPNTGLIAGPSGAGASSPFGGGGGAIRSSSNPAAGIAGGDAYGYGSGGAGGAGQVISTQSYAGGPGGAGAPGILIIEW